jgi:quinol monooxygenase YgiN
VANAALYFGAVAARSSSVHRKHVFLVEKWRDQEALDAHAKNTYKDWIIGRKVARCTPAD